jgi:hypothetical protein
VGFRKQICFGNASLTGPSTIEREENYFDSRLMSDMATYRQPQARVSGVSRAGLHYAVDSRLPNRLDTLRLFTA